MSCAACSSRVEKAVSKVPGVSSCAVNLLTNSMNVEGTADSSAIIAAVEKAGYGASVAGQKQQKKEEIKDNATKKLVTRLVSSLAVLIVLMYFSMGHAMWGFPVPKFFEHNHIALGLLQLILSAVVCVINQKFFINGVKGVINRSPNMVILGCFLWFLIQIFLNIHGKI